MSRIHHRRNRRSVGGRPQRRRYHRNPVAQGFFSALMPYLLMGGVAAFVYEKYGAILAAKFGGTPGSPTLGSADTSPVNTLGQLITNPGNEIATLTADVKNSVSGIAGLASSGVTSVENGINSLWQSAKAAL